MQLEKASEPPGAPARGEPRVGGALGAAIAAALLFSAVRLMERLPEQGLVLGLLALVSPFPLILWRLRGGARSAALAAALATLLLGIVLSTGQALGFLMVLAAPGLLMAEAMARGRGLLRGCTWAVGLLCLVIGSALIVAGPEMAESVGEPMERLRSPEFLEEMESRGLPPERVEDWTKQLQALQAAWNVVYPAAFLIMGAVLVLANAALVRAYLVRREPGWLGEGEFERVRWSLGLVVVFVAAGGAVLVPSLRGAAYNTLLIVAFLFALQGLAVVIFYTRRLAAPPLLRAGLIVLVLLNPWAPQMLALLGLFDTWFDFRKWATPPKAPEA